MRRRALRAHRLGRHPGGDDRARGPVRDAAREHRASRHRHRGNERPGRARRASRRRSPRRDARPRAARASPSCGTVVPANASSPRWRSSARDAGAATLSAPRRRGVPRKSAEPARVLARAAGGQSARLRGAAGRVLPVLLQEGRLLRSPRCRRRSDARLPWSRGQAIQPDRDRPVGPRQLELLASQRRRRSARALDARRRLARREPESQRARPAGLEASLRLEIPRHATRGLVLRAGAGPGAVAALPRTRSHRRRALSRRRARGVRRDDGCHRRGRRTDQGRLRRCVAGGGGRRPADAHPERLPVGDLGRARLRRRIARACRVGVAARVWSYAAPQPAGVRLRILVALRTVRAHASRSWRVHSTTRCT